MHISRKSRYALRALVELAERSEGAPDVPVRLADIASARGISVQFLEQLFAALRRGGLLASQRGVAGGFVFARPPQEISVLDVVEALDGVIAPATCTAGEGECDRLGDCGAADVWFEAKYAVEDVLRRTSIADVAARERATRAQAAVSTA